MWLKHATTLKHAPAGKTNGCVAGELFANEGTEDLGNLVGSWQHRSLACETLGGRMDDLIKVILLSTEIVKLGMAKVDGWRRGSMRMWRVYRLTQC